MSTSVQSQRPRDLFEREVIQNELDRNMMVLAGAGAGKTHELVGRMIALLRAGKVSVDRMAAITFTRKAAGELRDRFVDRLRDAIAGAGGGERDRLEAALRQVDQCFMGTIHSFCGRLLRARPIEARVPPDFAEVDGAEERRIARAAWDAFLRERYADEDSRVYELEEAGIGPEELWDFYRRRAEIHELDLRTVDVPPPDLENAALRAIAFVREVQGHLPPVLSSKKDGMMRLVEEVLAAAAHRGIDGYADAAALLERFPRNPVITQKCWLPDKEYAKRLKADIYPAFYVEVVERALRQWREHLFGPAARLVDDAVAYSAHVRRMEGTLTFHDLLRLAAEMLREHAGVRAYFQRRFEVILVDEFQDTDPLQAEILLYLTGTDHAEKDWRRLVPRARSLFLVGDEKQSIYRFRRADVATFRFIQARIEDTGGRIVHLNTSFRSLGNLCGWLNRAFPSVFAAHEAEYQAEYGELYDFRDPGADPLCVRRLDCPKVYKNSAADIIDAEASRIAGFIQAALAGKTRFNGDAPDALLGTHAKPSDFLILTRTRTHLSRYAAALEEVGVPYDVTGSKGLVQSDEIRSLAELLHLVREPDNPVHFVALLRGLFFGFSDAELYEFRRAGGRFEPDAEPPVALDDAIRGRVEAAQELFRGAAALVQTHTPSAAIECLLNDSGLSAMAAVQPRGSTRAGNLVRFLSFIRTLEARGLHWGEIVSELKEVVAGGAYDLEEMALDYGSPHAVRVMNVHQAKGLQARVVFLADPYNPKEGTREPDCHVSRVGGDPHLSLLVQRRMGEYARKTLAQPVGWDQDAEIENRYVEGEETRLLYVAATRAENLLVVSTYPDGSESGHRYGDLYVALADVPELDTFEWTGVDAATALPADLDERLAEQRDRLVKVRRPSYRRATISQHEHDEAVFFKADAGRGRDFGSLVHTVLEEVVRSGLPSEATAYVEAQCEAQGFPAADAEGIAQMIDALRRSAIWDEIVDSAEVYTEVPLAVYVDDTLIRGKIDLIYRAGGGWKIIDYKTDIDVTSAQFPLHVTQYADQVRAYARHWETVTGESVVSAGLYGTGGEGGYMPVIG